MARPLTADQELVVGRQHADHERCPALKNGELMCLTFFAKTSAGGFVEVGTAKCTTAPY
jgi:hypothetical protein